MPGTQFSRASWYPAVCSWAGSGHFRRDLTAKLPLTVTALAKPPRAPQTPVGAESTAAQPFPMRLLSPASRALVLCLMFLPLPGLLPSPAPFNSAYTT